MEAALKSLPGAISKMSVNMQAKSVATGESGGGNAIKALFSAKEGAALTRKDLDALTKNDGSGIDLRNVNELKSLWDGLTAEEQKAFGSFNNFANDIVDSINIA
jgi:hypothetical protein